ncbi:MAG: hypothetical protein R3F49_10190 [Planctomycetota bacterium]
MSLRAGHWCPSLRWVIVQCLDDSLDDALDDALDADAHLGVTSPNRGPLPLALRDTVECDALDLQDDQAERLMGGRCEWTRITRRDEHNLVASTDSTGVARLPLLALGHWTLRLSEAGAPDGRWVAKAPLTLEVSPGRRERELSLAVVIEACGMR